MTVSILDVLRDSRARLSAERATAVHGMEQVLAAAKARGAAHLDVAEDAAVERHTANVGAADEQLGPLQARITELEDLAARQENANRRAPAYAAGGHRAGTSPVRAAAFSAIERNRAPHRVIEELTRAVEADPSDAVARIFTATADPAFASAFAKVIRDPLGFMAFSDDERASWARVDQLKRALQIGGTGGYMTPATLEPGIVAVTGNGALHPWRSLATIKRSATGVYKGVTAAQFSATWTAESAATTATTPTLSQPSVSLYMARAAVVGSFEMFEDTTDLIGELTSVFQDTINITEAESFTNGTGSAQPTGAFYGTQAVTASKVSATTASTFSAGSLTDVYRLQAALPARHQPGASWVAALPTLQTIRRMNEGSTGGNSSFWTSLGAGIPPELLGRPAYECSAVTSTTTTGAGVLAYADWSKYWIADHIGGSMVELVPNMVDGDGKLTGERGLFLHWRTGAGWIGSAESSRILVL